MSADAILRFRPLAASALSSPLYRAPHQTEEGDASDDDDADEEEAWCQCLRRPEKEEAEDG
eukprot:6115031-Pyramimonas_sp.AAC.1